MQFMIKVFRRLFLAGLCGLTVAAAAGAADAPPASHRLIEADFGNLAQAEAQLARRLRHTEDLQKLQELVKGLNKSDPKQLEEFQDVVRNHPDFFDDPEVAGLLKQIENQKQKGGVFSPDFQKNLLQKTKEITNKYKSQDSSAHNEVKGGPPNGMHTPPDDLLPLPESTPPPAVQKPEGLEDKFKDGLKDILTKINHSPEGDELRTAALDDLAKADEGSTSSADLSDFLQHVLSQQQAAWLSRNLKLPPLPNFDGWTPNTNLPTGSPAAGASSGVGLDAMVWIVALGLFGAAAVIALRAASRQAAAARAKAWSVGPWPVDPSRVTTREDLIRAFEHLAFLRIGLAARPLNHLDVAGRLGEADGPAGRLARLYEQARYAPSEESLPADELTTARGDLSTLAGATA